MRGTIVLRLSILQMVLLSTVMTVAAAEANDGFYLGAEMVFVDIGGAVNTGDLIASGDGAGITAGYGINRNVAVEASYQSTKHAVTDGRKVDLTAGLIGLKASLQIEDSYIEPYLLLGIGKYSLDSTKGDGWRCGVGMNIGLSPVFSMTMSIARHFIEFDSSPTESGDVTSMDIGIAYHFR